MRNQPVFQRVGKQIVQHAGKRRAIQRENDGRIQIRCYRSSPALQQRPVCFQIFPKKGRKRRGLRADGQMSGTAADKRQCVNPFGQIPCPERNGRKISPLLFRSAGQPFLKCLRVAADCRQRCPQIVGDAGDRIFPALYFRFPFLRLVFKRRKKTAERG